MENKKGKIPFNYKGHARQIGKSFSVEKFGRDNFKNVVVINFEATSHFAHCFEEDLNPKRIISTLEALVGQRIIPNQTLLFFDEIQHCACAILSLRYFKEKIPDLHVIAAGSLLEFWLRETLPAPYLYPHLVNGCSADFSLRSLMISTAFFLLQLTHPQL